MSETRSGHRISAEGDSVILDPQMTHDCIEMLLAQDESILEDIWIFEQVLKHCFKIRLYGGNKFGPFILTAGQRRLLELFFDMMKQGLPIRILVLKARQLGISSLIAAILTILMFLRSDISCAVAAHKKESVSEFLYDYYMTFLRFLPDELDVFTKKRNERGGHRLLATNSFLACEHETEIRGRAMDYLHLSEAAFYKDLPTFMGAVSPAIHETPDSGIFMESTALGYDDDFHRRWTLAEEGNDIFKPLFLGWYLHPNYRHEFRDMQELHEFKLSITRKEHPRWGLEIEIYDHLIEEQKIPEKEVLERLKWRRWKLGSITLLDFYREYPMTADEAFLHTDSNVFDPVVMKWYATEDVSEPIMEGEMEITQPRFYDHTPLFVHSKPAILKVKEEPDPDGEYVFGVDTSRGKNDYCSLQIIKRRPFMQVAVLRGYEGRNMISSEFAEQAFMLWKWYNEGHWAIENNDSGLAVIDLLLEWGAHSILTHDVLLPNSKGSNKDYGWNNNTQTGIEMVEKMKYEIINKRIRLFDIETIREMNQFVYKVSEGTGTSEGTVRAMAKRKGQTRKPGDSEMGFYDDRVISLGSAIMGHLVLPPPRTARELRIEQQQTDHDILYGDQPYTDDEWDGGVYDIGYNPFDYIE